MGLNEVSRPTQNEGNLNQGREESNMVSKGAGFLENTLGKAPIENMMPRQYSAYPPFPI